MYDGKLQRADAGVIAKNVLITRRSDGHKNSCPKQTVMVGPSA